MLAISLAIILAAFALQVRHDERVTPRFMTNLPLPPTCLSYEWFGVKCPGCGLTRSFIDLSRGDWDSAWNHHRLGWLLALAVLLQVPYRLLSLRHPHPPLLGIWFPRVFGYLLIGALVANWMLLITGY